MSKETAIAWTDHTFNPWWGCRKISEGCRNCYADTLAKRYGHNVWGNDNRRTFGKAHWNKPLSWDRDAEKRGKRARIFCGSMCDVFENNPTAAKEREKLWPLIRSTPSLDWQLLTKRPENIKAMLPPNWKDGYHNVWLGSSVEDRRVADRIDILRSINARIRFVSYEPAIGPLAPVDLSNIHWIIYGGESGPGYRPENKQWARDMLANCREYGAAFFHKQSAAPWTERGIELDGKIIREYPKTKRNELHNSEKQLCLSLLN